MAVLVPEVGSVFGTPPRVPLEEHMRLLNKIGMPALMLGAAFFVTPAMAQNDENAPSSDNPAAAAPAQPSQDANTAAAPAQSAQDAASAAAPAQSAQDATSAAASRSSSSSAYTQLAMNTTGNASDVSSIPDNQHKYSRARRGSDNRSENVTTKELNEKEASLNGASSASAQ
jgi:hypothetical protein